MERIQSASADLADLKSIDVLIELDNELLRARLQSALNDVAKISETVQFSATSVRFDRQYIALDAKATITDADGHQRLAEFAGDILLMYTANRLIWRPRFDRIDLGPPVQALGESETPTQDIPPRLLDRVNEEMGWNLYGLDRHYLEIDPVPMAVVESGASLTRMNDVIAKVAGDLGGVFMTEGSAILIEPQTTRIALDLIFVPSVFSCPADVSITRSVFAREIRNREPVGITTVVQTDRDIQHYFTEIAGAAESTAVIHYWFADGQPVSVIELKVEPSARWRTWSSRPPDHEGVRNWEVLVVEKGSGCILESTSILSGRDALETGAHSSKRQAFNTLREAFIGRLDELSVGDEPPELARIAVSRPFLVGALNEALRDLELVAELQINDSNEGDFSAGMAAFEVPDLKCERRECRAERECVVNYDACPLTRDTRDCTKCLFRNPLNNRCVNEGQDPLCEAAKVAINKRKERDREVCVRNAQAERDACERLREQEIRSCELEVSSDLSACQARRRQLEELRNAPDVAQVTGNASLSGTASLSFADFRVEGDLERMWMNLSMRADLDLEGQIAFQPTESLGSLASCVAAWQGPYRSRVALPRWDTSLVTSIDVGPEFLGASWSGFVQPVAMNPAPLESLMVSNPSLLAGCQLGLGVQQVANALTGVQGDFFRGRYGFAVQPLPTTIRWLAASFSMGGDVYSGSPRLNSTHLVFDF